MDRLRCVLVAVVATLVPLGKAQLPDKPAGYVTDAAHVMSSTDIDFLSTRCARLDQDHRAQIAIVTIGSLQGNNIKKASLDLFRKWGIGHAMANDGLLFLLAIRERQSRITVGYGLEKIISYDKAASILEAIPPDLRTGRYAAALDDAIDSIEKLLRTAQREH